MIHDLCWHDLYVMCLMQFTPYFLFINISICFDKVPFDEHLIFWFMIDADKIWMSRAMYSLVHLMSASNTTLIPLFRYTFYTSLARPDV